MNSTSFQGTRPAAWPDRGVYALLLGTICVLVYANSFWGVFVFDEYSSITTNAGIKHFWPPDWLTQAPNISRPAISFTLMLNYLMGGQQYLFPYHLFNLVIHLAAALTLYGVLWRTLERVPENRCAGYARPLAFGIALLWSVHPLQTGAVTYIIQRCESQMGLFLLLTLYCVIRAASDPRLPLCEWVSPRLWSWLAVLCCAAGMGSKQVMVSAPLLALLYDRAFLSGSFEAALKSRGWLYTGLFATEGVLVACVVFDSFAGQTAGFGNGVVSSPDYLLTQCRVIPYYLRLTVWPDVLCIDHDAAQWFVHSLRAVWLPFVLLSLTGVVTALGIILNQRWAFLGAWFFLILAPSSSFMPINDPVFEHRMYLPLAAVLTALVLEAFALLPAAAAKPGSFTKPLLFAVALLALPLSVRTVVRNHDYSSDELIWRRAVALYPHSARICNNLGNALAGDAAAMGTPEKLDKCREKHEAAVRCFLQALDADPRYADALFNLGVEYSVLKQNAESERYYLQLFKLSPHYSNAHSNLADVYKGEGRYIEAVEQYRLEQNDSHGDVLRGLEEALRLKGDEEQ